MNLLSLFKRNRASDQEERSNPLENPAAPLGQSMDYLLYLLNGEPTASGEPISEFHAMQLTTVFACVSCIARDVGTIPLYVYEQTKGGHQRVDDSVLADLLNIEPHPDMTPSSFKEAVTSNVVLSGNGYAEITWNGAGQPAMLTPRIATKTHPIRLPNGDLAYRCTDVHSDGIIVRSEDMLHIPALAMDGILGLNPIKQLRQSLGIASASEKAAARLYGNGVLTSGILTMPAGLSTEQKAQLKQSFEQSASGKNQMRPIVVPTDAKYTPLSINPTDAQFLESRKYSDEAICRMFGVPPHKVGILDRATNNNIEHQGIEYVTSTLRPYLVRWEQEIQRKLIPRIGRNAGRYYVRFDVSELLRGDQASTSAYYSAALQWGWLNRNEVRDKEGLNPIGDQGEVYMAPFNMMNAKAMIEVPPAPTGSTGGGEPNQQPAEEPSVDQPDSTVGDTEGQRSIIDACTRAYRRMFRDAMGRCLARDCRDLEAFSKTLGPVLTTIAEQSISDANSTMRTELKEDLASGFVDDYLKALEKRAKKWDTNDADQHTETELPKAIRSIVIGVYREAGASVPTISKRGSNAQLQAAV